MTHFPRLFRGTLIDLYRTMDTKCHPKSIKLPDTVEVFGNLKNAKRFAIDIGNMPSIL